MAFNTFDDKSPPLDLTKLDENFANVDDQLRNRIWADKFPGYDATGATDSALAINTAVAAAAVIGNCDVYLTGTPRINSPIVLAVPATPLKRYDMPRLVGSGINDCVIQPTFSGKAIKVRGLAPVDGSGTQSGTYFFWGGGLSDFTIDGSLAPAASTPFAGGATDGIEMMAVWYTKMTRLKFRRLRHGIHFAADPAYNPNPDWSAAGIGVIENCSFERLQGWGIWNELEQGAPSWRVYACHFVLCGMGGIRCRSSAWDVAFNGCTGLGWVDEVTPGGSVDGCFLELDSSAAAKIEVHQNEMDGSRGASVRLVNCGSAHFIANRQVVRGYRDATSPLNDRVKLPGANENIAYPQRAYHVAPASWTNAPRNVAVELEEVRLDDHLPALASPDTAAFAYADFANTANAAHLSFERPLVSRQVVGPFSFLIQRGAPGAPGANMHVRNNFRWSCFSDGNNEQFSGRPAPRWTGTISGSPSTTTTESVVVFGQPDAITTQLAAAPNNWNFYSGGVFTTQADDFHTVAAKLAFVPTASGQSHTLRLYINGSLADEESLVTSGTHRHFLHIVPRAWFLAKGATIEIRVISNVAAPITASLSFLSIQQRGA